MDDSIQKQLLNYIWDKKEGIYYISNFAVSKKHCLENKKFTTWLSVLELLCGFSLFSEFARDDVVPHLIGEVNRIMIDDVKLPPAHPITSHYAESWRDKNTRKNDMILRILRLLVKC